MSCEVLLYNTEMRTSKTLSITLPPEMLSRAERLAQRENRTMSELVREALRWYERRQWWEEINTYGRARAQQIGLSESDVVPMVKQVRAERQSAQKGGRRR